jgi:hypothetical protein
MTAPDSLCDIGWMPPDFDNFEERRKHNPAAVPGLTASDQRLLDEAMSAVEGLTQEQVAILLIQRNWWKHVAEAHSEEIERLHERWES